MTSRNSFFSQSKENRKHRLGVIMIMLLGAFFQVVLFVIQMQTLTSEDGILLSDGPEAVLKELFYNISPKGQVVVMILAAGVGILLAASAFHFLHSKKQSDYYLALPIKRNHMYQNLILGDFLMFVVVLAVMLILEAVVITTTGFFTGKCIGQLLQTFGIALVVFLLFYLAMTLAMLLTGNTFVAGLGMAVFCSYMAIVIPFLYPTLAEMFYSTFADGWNSMDWCRYFSPVTLAIGVIKNIDHGRYIFVSIVWILGLLGFNLFVFNRRPAETAGRAMAFPRWNSLIRLLMVIPFAIYGGMFFNGIAGDSTKIWILIGILISGVIGHGVIESIFQFDAKAAFGKKIQMAAAVVVSLLIVGVFWFDLTGYDSYIPKEKNVQAMILEPYLYTDRDGSWETEKTGLTGENLQKVYEKMPEVVKSNKNYQVVKLSEDARYYRGFKVKYLMRDGKSVVRRYEIDDQLFEKIMNEIYATKEFKSDQFSLYTADLNLITKIWINDPMNGNTYLNISKDQQIELVKCYRDELLALTYQELTASVPMATLDVGHNRAPSTAMSWTNDCMSYFYIYPQFEKTQNMLKELGYEMPQLSEYEMGSVLIREYGDANPTEYLITDKKVIEKYKDRFVFADYYYSMNQNYTMDYVEGELTLNDGRETKKIGIFMDLGTAMELKIAAGK